MRTIKDHGGEEERKDAAKEQVNAEAEVEQPDEDDIQERPDPDRVPEWKLLHEFYEFEADGSRRYRCSAPAAV